MKQQAGSESRAGARVLAVIAAAAGLVAAGPAGAQLPTWVQGDSEVVREIKNFRGTPMNLVTMFVDPTPPGLLSADGEYQTPGARVAAVKDLYDLAWLVDINPRVRIAVSLRPSTLEAVETTVQGYDRWIAAGRPAGAMPGCDRWLRLSLTPVASLGNEDRAFIADHFFDVPVRDVFSLYPAFGRLAASRGGKAAAPGAALAASLGDAGLRDLVAWQNLAILSPDFATDAITLQGGEKVDFRPYFKKAQGFTDEDIAAICDLQMKVLRALVPEYRALAQLGRLEIVTQPFYDPVLPLLQDPSVVRKTAGANHPIPAIGTELAGEADAQVAMAVEQHRRLFGAAPAGIWLGSGGLEPSTLAVCARQGLNWVAADHNALRGSVMPGRPHIGERLRFALYESNAGGRRMQLLFEDPEIFRQSLGADYGHEPSLHGANMFVVRLFQQQGLQADHAGRYVCSLVVPIDWREFERNGGPFLHSALKQLSGAEWCRMLTPGQAFTEVKERNPVSRVSGTNVASHVYTQWVGGASQNRAWKQLAALRHAIDAAKASGTAGARIAESERLLRRAEGRDLLAAMGAEGAGAKHAEASFRATVARAYAGIDAAPPADLGARAGDGGTAAAASP